MAIVSTKTVYRSYRATFSTLKAACDDARSAIAELDADCTIYIKVKRYTDLGGPMLIEPTYMTHDEIISIADGNYVCMHYTNSVPRFESYENVLQHLQQAKTEYIEHMGVGNITELTIDTTDELIDSKDWADPNVPEFIINYSIGEVTFVG